MSRILIVTALVLGGAVELMAQPPAGQSTTASPSADQDGVLRLRLPTLTVTAQKEPEDVQEAPVSVTAVSGEVLDAAGVRTVSEAAEYAPNTFFTEFTARKLSNARFRGIGASPANPAVTTYIDGVPQLHANSSSVELLDVGQIEIVRGPQSALFGRNTLGGLINITSRRPSLAGWGGTVSGPFGNFGTADFRASVSGPLARDRVGLGVSFGYSGRDGFTRNAVTGHDLDSRSAVFAKTQLLWLPAAAWEARLIVTGERARDGDYALADLGSLRATPFRVQRDFEGHTYRDIVAPTFLLRHAGGAVNVSAITGLVWWETDDATDLDYSPLPLVTRDNNEKDVQFTQEVRFSSSKSASLSTSGQVTLRWQAGASFFTQNYEQQAVNHYAPFVLPFVPFATSEHSPQAALDDRGVGVYGEATFTVGGRFDATVGLRGDVEHKEAALDTFFVPALGPPASVAAEDTFGDVSPQVTAAYRLAAGRLLYATAARGFKAGGFNAASPPGSEAYGEEHSWNYEGGVKTLWLGQRLSINGAVFYLRWRDMQVNVPGVVPGQFFIANAAGATSKGADVEVSARVAPGCDLFGGFGYTNARFVAGSVSNGIPVGGNRLANAPEYTADVGGQYSVAVTSQATAYVRAEVLFRGAYQFDDANTAEQEAYSLAAFRAGVRVRRLYVEGWVRNAFDTRYIPVAFPFDPRLAPSGFVGEMGAPRTYGVRAGVTF